jgi:cytoskeletal protein CcmA (bactofilin family)
MKRFVQLCISLFILPVLLVTASVPTASAADFRAGDQVSLTNTAETLTNPYIFGGNIAVESPIANELTAAGGDLVIGSTIENSAFIAGGNILMRGAVGNNARIAGGNITIDGPVANDLVIAGGSVRITNEASIGGDILFAGGSLTVDGPVQGGIRVAGGDIVLNNSVGGDVTGEVGELKLGPEAQIAGNLTYKAQERAQIAQGATVQGRTDYQPSEQRRNDEGATGLIAGAALYKLAVDIILTVLLIYFFQRAVTAVLRRMKNAPLRSGAIGFGFFILVPLAAFFLLLLFWLGIATFLFYGLAYLIALYLMKAFIGWILLTWWYSSKKRDYIVDWKAGILGPIVVFLLMLIPILGWLTIAILFLIALGAFIEELIRLSSNQRVTTKAVSRKR